VLSKRDFSALGGTVFSPTIVYAFEFVITALEGENLVRGYKPATALYLWKAK
jgi:predicted DNA-binding protein with PD1-like motif